MQAMNWINEVKWDAQGLVPVIAQEKDTGDVLMFAWMNREALEKTAELGRAVYFSRSRGRSEEHTSELQSPSKLPFPPFFFLRTRRPPRSPLFPYTPLFRSCSPG